MISSRALSISDLRADASGRIAIAFELSRTGFTLRPNNHHLSATRAGRHEDHPRRDIRCRHKEHFPVAPIGLMRACTACLTSRVKGISSNVSRVNLFDAFERRQFLYGLPALFFGQPNFVEALKIQPELWARSEKMTQ